MPDRPPTVLLVEDEPDIRATLADCLQAQGYETVEAGDGRQALDRLRQGVRPDLIVLDLMMPVMDGWRFLARLARLPGGDRIPVVVATAATRSDPRVRRLSPAAFLFKPFGIDEFCETVARLAPCPAAA